MKFHNSLTRDKQEFTPIDPSHVRMYVCGPTVYDRVHLGNARPVVIFDTLFRLLKLTYDKVTYVRNITDVDDKINERARESGISIDTLTSETTVFFHEDMAQLNALEPTVEPKATHHIPEMITLIQTLIDRGLAYEAQGHVLFSVAKDPKYGHLSGRNREDMIAGARVEVAPYKQDPADFVLWKPSEEGIPGWESPWGFGRPGWHIECSAMSCKYLGETFDIHGGGQDLLFPHHENELAQSTGAFGPDTFAKVWLHNGMITVEGEKMSKSLGNFITVKDALAKYNGELIRFVLLSTHYRQALDWNETAVNQAHSCLNRLYTSMRDAPAHLESAVSEDIVAALEDDLNTPLAFSKLFELCTQINKAKTPERKMDLQALLKGSGQLMGLMNLSSEQWFKGNAGDDVEEIEGLIEARLAARAAKDFAKADEIRDALVAKGLILEDSSEGTLWRRK
jgi:cysteinyl-tRNA synthetase